MTCDDGSSVFCNACEEDSEECAAKCPAPESDDSVDLVAVAPESDDDEPACAGGYLLGCANGAHVFCNACEEDTDECEAKCPATESSDDDVDLVVIAPESDDDEPALIAPKQPILGGMKEIDCGYGASAMCSAGTLGCFDGGPHCRGVGTLTTIFCPNYTMKPCYKGVEGCEDNGIFCDGPTITNIATRTSGFSKVDPRKAQKKSHHHKHHW